MVLFELVGEVGSDDCGLEHPLVVLRGLPRPLDGAARDPDLGDLVALQVAQELAVGNDGDLLVERPDVLQDEDADQRDDEIPGVPLVLLAYRRHRGSDSGNLSRRFNAAQPGMLPFDAKAVAPRKQGRPLRAARMSLAATSKPTTLRKKASLVACPKADFFSPNGPMKRRFD